ncbi:MAG: bifunctional hydroxymethylpyrimidine kinase/phosphomethylpyrimidine kinase [Blastocatellia bacterium]|nr:bifunctional hydroxymethylpyrimidine kinase/phosphomethylpyrimidine kinase [Blastocatellia bacterium]
MNTDERTTPICLTIAGLDPSGGAGTIADVKTFFAFGCYPAAAIASITYQNTQGVYGATHQSAEELRSQVEPILNDLEVSAVKTGMLPTAEIIEETARLISENDLHNVVIDPVVRSTSGFDLIDGAALKRLIEMLFPLADIVTPNAQEAERISGVALLSEPDIVAAANIMFGMGAKAVLIKGGHLRHGSSAVDHLLLGGEHHRIDAPYYDTTSTHGTGCTLAAAIAANLAKGKTMLDAVRISKDFVNEAIRTAPKIGKGNSPINIQPIERSG